MLVRLLKDLNPGASGPVASGQGEWPATWRGSTTGLRGEVYDVEVDIGDQPLAVHRGAEAVPAEGVHLCDTRLVVCGVLTLFDDGLIALDLKPGTVLVEPSGAVPSALSGTTVHVLPDHISIFPAGI
ncbi:hypothetical protein [Nocardia asteroides]|uniref:hypothetical protein n=1 Tax=Nocardia asteroides TaxID=1824 RepID=UPI0036513BAE